MNKLDEQGRKQGHWEDYYSDDSLCHRYNYRNSLRHGLCTYYFNDGTIIFNGYFNDERRCGYFECIGVYEINYNSLYEFYVI